MGILRLLWAIGRLVANWFRYRFFRWYALVAGGTMMFFLLQLFLLFLPLPVEVGATLSLLALVVALIALGIFLIIPSVVWVSLRPIWMNILIVQIGISLAQLIKYQLSLSPVIVMTALLLFVASWLIGSGAYRPYEVRAARRSLSTLAMWAALLVILWQPVIVPAARGVGEVVASSPIGNLYRVLELRTRRVVLGEEAKTSSLTELKNEFRGAHRARWEKGIEKIPSIPLSSQEWDELGVRDP